MDKSKYPDNWDEIANQVKTEAGWKCRRCLRPHEPEMGYCLTVHHWDRNPMNCEKSNLVALCQRCHLQIQACPDDPDQLFFVPAFNDEWQKFIKMKKNQEKKGVI